MAILFTLLCLLAAPPVFAQRQLSWDSLDVTARLDDEGVLHVTELQTMVFTGDWNGGERTFYVRPRQQFDFDGMERIDASTKERVALVEDDSVDDVDEYAFTDNHTLRWRARLPTSPPFAHERITYAIHYRLSRILLQEDERYVLDHDFAFPDRDGAIERYSLRLTFDGAWTPLEDVQETYTAGPIPPGRGDVRTIPLRFSGAGSPAAIDTRRSREVVMGVMAILGVLVVSIGWMLVREQRLGRFAPVSAEGIDAGWIEKNVLAYPAEIVGAAWDQDVDKDEVVAIISRLVSERKLSGGVGSTNSGLHLQLQAARESFQGYERTLVDGLFFEGRSSTSTEAVQSHYEKQGYDPAKAIAPQLLERVNAVLPQGKNPRVWPVLSILFFLAGAGCLVREWQTNENGGPTPIILGVIALVLAGIGQFGGVAFRARIDWGMKALIACLVIPVLTAVGVAALLWFWVGTGAIEVSPWIVGAATALTLWIVWTAVNGLKSRNHRDAIAFRKMLATGRRYFALELLKERPSLRDEWYPWIAGFGLVNEVAQWSVRHRSDDTYHSTTFGSSSSESSSSSAAWTGAAGGRSGGAGGGAAWATAVGGMAAGVSPPSSSSGSNGGSSSGSSSGGSSGGGGGGGW